MARHTQALTQRASRVRAIACVVIALLASCATPLLPLNQPVQGTKVRVAPWESHELCTDAIVGDRIDYRFDATEPVAFAIGYRENGAQLLPWTRAAALTDSGIFPVRYAQRYCLTWQAGGAGALLDYRVIIHRTAP